MKFKQGLGELNSIVLLCGCYIVFNSQMGETQNTIWLTNGWISTSVIIKDIKKSDQMGVILIKPYSFLMFSGGRERVHWEQMG